MLPNCFFNFAIQALTFLIQVSVYTMLVNLHMDGVKETSVARASWLRLNFCLSNMIR